jgi:hypothetical protein
MEKVGEVVAGCSSRADHLQAAVSAESHGLVSAALLST